MDADSNLYLIGNRVVSFLISINAVRHTGAKRKKVALLSRSAGTTVEQVEIVERPSQLKAEEIRD